MKKHLLLLFCLVSSLMALAESGIKNIPADVKLSASSQADANIYTILLSNTNLYFSTKEVEDGRYTTYSLSSTPEEFFIEPVDYNPGCYKITGVNGKKVGIHSTIYWDFADEDNALWEINNLEGLPTQIIRHRTTTGFGPDVAEEGKGVFTNKRDVLWQVKRINHTVTASGTCGANLTWKFENGVLTISGTGAMYEFDAIMENRPWELYSSYIGSVIIGNGVTSIGEYAFQNFSGLTSITIPNSVTSIGYRAFSGCSALTSVTIPNSVTSIGSETFEGCIGLTAVTIPNSVTTINHSAFSGCHIIYSKYINNSRCSDKDNWGLSLYDLETKEGLLIKDNVVGFCRHWASSVVIPNFVTSIGNHAFDDCNGLTSITIPNSVTSIGDYAFYGCDGLTSITIPNSVTSIGDNAFQHCRPLISITIPNSVTSIGKFTFHDCI